jgi:translation initiation factor 1A
MSSRSTKKHKKRKGAPTPGFEVRRVRTPRENEGEVLAVVVQMLGFDRVRAKCADGHIRVCRIRGRMKKRVWIRPGDVIIVVPWSFQTDRKADIIWRYTKAEADFLKRNNYLPE